MKNLLNLQGVHKLSKKEQEEISGAWSISRPYCGGPKRCCVTTPNGAVFCDYGYCQPNGSCMWA